MRQKVINHIRTIIRFGHSLEPIIERSELDKLSDDTLFQIWMVISKTAFKEEANHC